MSPETAVAVKDLKSVRDAVQKYLTDNAGWRAEERDLVWSHRYVVAKLALLAGQRMTFGQLVEQIRAALSETTSQQVRFLTPDLIAQAICDPAE